MIINWTKLWCTWSENADDHWKHELLKTLSRKDLTWNKDNQWSCKLLESCLDESISESQNWIVLDL